MFWQKTPFFSVKVKEKQIIFHEEGFLKLKKENIAIKTNTKIKEYAIPNLTL